MTLRGLSFFVGFCLALSACSGSAEETTSNPAASVPPPPPETGAAAFVLEPANLNPGSEFSVTFDEDSFRGGYYTLSKWNGTGWGDAIYLLESDANGSAPSAVLIREGVGTEDYGVSGPGPDGLVMPDGVADGYWRLCLESERTEKCVQLTVGTTLQTNNGFGLRGSRWQVVEIDGEVIEVDVNTIEIPTVSFRDTTVSGHDGCNGFGGDYALDDDRLTVSNAVGELEGCSIPDGSNQSILPNLVLGSHFGFVEDFNIVVNDDTMTWFGRGYTVVLQRD